MNSSHITRLNSSTRLAIHAPARHRDAVDSSAHEHGAGTPLSHESWAGGASIWSADVNGRDLDVTTTVTEADPPERIAPRRERIWTNVPPSPVWPT